MRALGALIALAPAILLIHCTGQRGGPSVVPPPRLAIAAEDRPFLFDPLASFPLVVDDARAHQVLRAHLELTQASAAPEARAVSEGLLAVDPGFQPALVLLAQVEFVAGRADLAARHLEPIVAALPDYLAARILLAGSFERLGEIVEAVEQYRAIAELDQYAGERARALLPHALEILSRRVQEALSREQLSAARAAVEKLEDWDAEGRHTFQAQRDLASAEDDRAGELGALRHLVRASDSSARDLERLGELELELGDAGAALEIFRQLTAAEPAREDLREGLERAQFRWRLGLVPEPVRAQAERPILPRAGLAALLYWLVPEVKLSRPGSGHIATDVLDHPFREEIVRAVGLGLIDVDTTLHRFAPGAPATRQQALAAVLGAMALRREISTSCREAARQRSTLVGACEAARSCGLIKNLAECSARSQLSGGEALALIQAALRSP